LDPNEHESNCLTRQSPTPDILEAREPLTVNVFKHMPPSVDGCPLEDNQCAACQLALSPSTSFWLVNLCEKDLMGGSVSTNTMVDDYSNDLEIGERNYSRFTLDQVSYCIEMCEDTFQVQCQECHEILSRADYRDHTC